MREVKFRAWDTLNKKFISQSITIDLEVTIRFDGVFVSDDLSIDGTESGDRIILSQFTGLLDKNGKAIFEGDIVKYEQPLQLENGEIGIWHGGNRVCRDIRHLDFPEKPEYLKIIGNIYENKDLLK